ncbi:MAG: hypothetical protein SFX73_38530 [Kofleriaceae bacterium]|nr:hypothetical protein [Kofleriaceae bacterium]
MHRRAAHAVTQILSAHGLSWWEHQAAHDEPNQEAADAKAITVGQQVSAYLGCVSPTTDVYISDHRRDSYTATLPGRNQGCCRMKVVDVSSCVPPG